MCSCTSNSSNLSKWIQLHTTISNIYIYIYIKLFPNVPQSFIYISNIPQSPNTPKHIKRNPNTQKYIQTQIHPQTFQNYISISPVPGKSIRGRRNHNKSHVISDNTKWLWTHDQMQQTQTQQQTQTHNIILGLSNSIISY